MKYDCNVFRKRNKSLLINEKMSGKICLCYFEVCILLVNGIEVYVWLVSGFNFNLWINSNVNLKIIIVILL